MARSIPSRLPRVLVLSSCVALACAACGGGDEGDSSLSVAWTFASGDCVSNDVETVRVTWGPAGGESRDSEFACQEGSGTVGQVAGDSGGFAVRAEGLDPSGAVVAESYGTTASFSGGTPPGGHVVDVTLHPAGADVVVSWILARGGGCPEGVILPYFVTLYEAPATAGAAPTEVVTETQETCSSGQVTLEGVAPGDYVVEIDSRAVTPAVRGTAPVSVVAGQDAAVALEL